jgi:hypothetical protein
VQRNDGWIDHTNGFTETMYSDEIKTFYDIHKEVEQAGNVPEGSNKELRSKGGARCGGRSARSVPTAIRACWHARASSRTNETSLQLSRSDIYNHRLSQNYRTQYYLLHAKIYDPGDTWKERFTPTAYKITFVPFNFTVGEDVESVLIRVTAPMFNIEGGAHDLEMKIGAPCKTD